MIVLVMTAQHALIVNAKLYTEQLASTRNYILKANWQELNSSMKSVINLYTMDLH